MALYQKQYILKLEIKCVTSYSKYNTFLPDPVYGN